MSKKIILFIVEGITDQTCLGYVLDQLLSNQSVQFQLTDGDITTKSGNNSTNIAAKIGKIVNQFRGKIFKPSDFLEVVHLIDTDGAFISDDKIVQAAYEDPFYSDENILTNKVENIQKRNQQKSLILNRLITLNKVCKTIPYSVYFLSCNLDHVLHNQANLSKQAKSQCANRFDSEYGKQPTKFIDFLNNGQYAVVGNYKETWEFIKLDTHSLQRYTNFHLYFSNPKNPRD